MRAIRPAPLLAAVVATCVFGLAAGPVPARAPIKAPPLVAGARYLALGDSVTFGYEESQVVPAPDRQHAASSVAYPEMIAEELRLKVANAACPGETSSSLIDSSGPSNGCENVLGRPVGYRTMFPLHVRYRGSQLAYAVSYLRTHHNVRLVSLMIGANDFFVCQETTRDGCLSAGEQQAVFATIAKNARRILSAIRGKAHYRGQLVLVNYYSLNYASSLISGLSRELNAAVDGAARRFRVEIGDGYGQFLRAARIFGGDPCRAGLLTRLSTGGCGVHPSYAGQALLAQAVLRAVRSKG